MSGNRLQSGVASFHSYRVNRSLTEAKGFLEDYVSDGLVPLTDAIQAYQNMVMTGFSADQIEDMMKVLKDSAAFGTARSIHNG